MTLNIFYLQNHEESELILKSFNFHTPSKISAAIVSILLIIVCFYFLAIPRIINIDKYRLLIAGETSKALKLPIEIGKSRARMTWNLGIKIFSDNIVVKHFDNTPYLSTGPIEVEISVPYILKHQIRVRNINTENVQIDLKKLPNGKFDIEELISLKTKKQVKYKTIFHNTSINIDNYKIIFTDKFISTHPQYFISGKNFKISDFDPKEFIKVDVSGEIYSSNRPSTKFDVRYLAELPLDTKNFLKNELSINGEVENFYPDMYSKYLQAFTKEFSSMSGSGKGVVLINIARKEADIDELYFKGNVRDFSLYKTEGKDSPIFKGLTNVSVLVQQKNKNIMVKDITFRNKDIDVQVTGNIDRIHKNPQLNLNLISNNTKVESVFNLMPRENKHYNNLLRRLKKYKMKGFISANIDIKGAPKGPSLFGALQLNKFSMSNKSKIIHNADARVIFNDKNYNISSRATIGKREYLNVSGIFDGREDKINLNIVSNIIKWSSAQRLISALNDISNTTINIIKKSQITGKGSININISGNIKHPEFKGYLNFVTTKIKSPLLPVPIADLNGQIRLRDKNIIFSNLRAKLSQSSVVMNGTLSQNMRRSQPINLNIKAKVSSDDVKKYIKKVPLDAKGTFPLIASVKGNTGNWKLQGHMNFDKGDYINFKQDIGLPIDSARVLNFKISGNKRKIKVDDVALLAVSEQNPTIANTNLSPLIAAQGLAYDLPSKQFLFNNVTLNVTNPMNIQMLNPMLASESEEPFFGSGSFTSRVQFTGAAAPPAPVGDIVLRNITIPSKKLTINLATFDLTEDKIVLTDSDIVLADSQIKIIATAEKDFKIPFTINKINVLSPDLNFDKISDALKQNSDRQDNTLPVVIQDGNIQAQKFETGKLDGTNLNSDFDLTENEIFELKKLSFDAEGGSASGDIKYNIIQKDLEGIFITKNMSADDVTSTFWNLHDEVFGSLDSKSEFKTQGTTKQEVLKNTDGKLEFKIRDGRLVRLGSLEYLLLAANTLEAGIGNLDLNKIINLITREKTGDFKTLGGTLTMEDGILRTDNVKSQGKNLSLHLRGSLRMVDNYADLTILGRVHKRVVGKLGPLGNISINNLISDIPIAGFLPGSPGNEGVLDMIPLLEKIPVLGIGGRFARGRYRFFVVRIVGNLYDKSSVRSFRWITRKDMRGYRKAQRSRRG